MDVSAACTKIGAKNSRDLLAAAGIEMMSVTPMITAMLGDYTNPASRGFFEAMGVEGIYAEFARGNLR
jgi:hypothetical protein